MIGLADQRRQLYNRDRNVGCRAAVKYLEGDGFRGVVGIATIRREPPDVAVWMAFLVCLIGVLAFALIMTTTFSPRITGYWQDLPQQRAVPSKAISLH